MLCFDDGKATEYNTLLITDWLAHTPPEILAENFVVPAETFAGIPLHQLYIFQDKIRGPLAADLAAVEAPMGFPPQPLILSLRAMAPTRQTKGGDVRIDVATLARFPRNKPAVMPE